jgi:tetratricopeptide (TPR) repeat protein
MKTHLTKLLMKRFIKPTMLLMLLMIGSLFVFSARVASGQQVKDGKGTTKGKDQSGGSKVQTDKTPPKPAPAETIKPLGPPVPPPPPTQQELLSRAGQFMKDSKPEEAVKVYRQAVSLYPSAWQPYDRLARVLLSMKNYSDAADAARKATERNTDSPTERGQEYSLLTSALAELGKYAEARGAVERSIELFPGDLDYRLLRGEVDMRAKDYPAAQNDYLAALGLSPDSSRVHSALGDVYEQDNRHESALQEYDAALRALDSESQPDPAVRDQLKLSRANSLAGLKRFAEAEADVRAIFAKSSDNPMMHSALAQVLDAAGKHDGAIAEYKLALAKSAGDPILWGNLGWAQYNAGKYDDAIQSSRKALQLDGTQTYVRFNLGLIYAVRDQWSDSQKEYAAAIAGAAEPDIRAGIGDVRDALEKRPDTPALKRALDYLDLAEHRALGFSD